MLSGTICILALVGAIQAVQFHIQNNEPGPVWIGIQGNPGHPHLNNGGFNLNQGEGRVLNAPDNWAGRFWGRTWCNSQSRYCLTGDCGNRLECAGAGGVPPVSLAEVTLKGAGGLDFYDISFVDGYNLRIAMEPLGGQGDGGQYSCRRAACSVNLLDSCPNELRVVKEGHLVACNSACNAFNTDAYCCRGAHNTPQTCDARRWPQNYPAFFKQRCPDAYSYAYDDNKSTFTCRSNAYKITFG